MVRRAAWGKWWIGALAVPVTLVLAPAAVAAPTYTVTTTTDSNDFVCNVPPALPACSLRDAIAAANANPGSSIGLPSGTYTLSSTLGQLDISQSMTLTGQGATTPVIQQSALDGDRVLDIGPTAASTVTISGVEITGGNVTDSPALGGGVLIEPSGAGVSSTITLTNVLVEGNTATGANAAPGGLAGSAEGAGIYVDGGALTLSGGMISGNTATAGAGAGAATLGGAGSAGGDAVGGGLADIAGALTVSASTITGNTIFGGTGGGDTTATDTPGGGGDAEGAGIYAASTVSNAISDSTITGNQGTGGTGGQAAATGGTGGCACGGGVEVAAGPTTVLNGDTIATNTATGGAGGAGTPAGAPQYGAGAGVYIASGLTAPVVVNSTLLENTVAGPAVNLGGGIYAASPATLASDTLDANRATGGDGGNIYTNSVSGPVQAEDTIVAGGVADVAGSNCLATGSGAFGDLAPGHNLEDDTGTPQCGFSSSSAGDQAGVNPQLAGALASNGGQTETLSLSAASPARAAGGACVDPSQNGNPALTVDQRGEPRGASCDIGAFQTEAPQNTALPSISGTTALGSTLTCADGTWTGDGTLAFTGQWLRAGNAITGATGTSYTIVTADQGQRISCEVTATSAYGTASATSAAVTPAAPTPPVTPPVAPPVTPPAAPTLTHLSQSARTWREAHRGAVIASTRKPPTGTKFSFTLSESATVSMTFTQPVYGRVSHGKCVAQTKHNAHARSCKLKTVVRGTFTVSGHAGANTVTFYGMLANHHELPVGSYTLTVVATASGKSSTPSAISFTIVR